MPAAVTQPAPATGPHRGQPPQEAKPAMHAPPATARATSGPAPAGPRPLRPGAAHRHPAPALGLAAAAALALCAPAQALEIGPWTISGFLKAETTRGSNICTDCQKEPNENRQREWADALVYGKKYGSETETTVLFQPYLAFNAELPQGWRFNAMLSQRYRDGEIDIPGAVYEKNVAVTHEEYGSLRIGAMTSRTWAVADFPYASDFGISDAWPSAGAGYAMLGHAVRYTSRLFDVMDGDLVLEATYDDGPRGWERNDPWLLELWGKYTRGGLMLDAMLQVSRNGQPVSWGHAPFIGLTIDPADDDKLGGSAQSTFQLMGRYWFTRQIEATAGIRFNRWSGAYAVPTTLGRGGLWNNMFNVDWGGTDANGVPNPGYPARTTDFMAGVRYLHGKWAFNTGLVYLGKASTDNPSERGQSNSVLINTVGVDYNLGHGIRLYGLAGMVHYDRKGLAPLSMPSHNAFTNVDPRVATRGNWFGVGVVYTF